MPILKNPRHEKFAQNLAKGMTQEEAYADAGYKPSRSNASMLAGDQNISERVAEISGKALEQVEVTIPMVVRMLYDEARATGEGTSQSARVRAQELLGKHLGMFIDRRLLGVRRIEDMTEDEILALLGGEPDADELRQAAGSEQIGHA